jgi:hypothetical protein
VEVTPIGLGDIGVIERAVEGEWRLDHGWRRILGGYS